MTTNLSGMPLCRSWHALLHPYSLATTPRERSTLSKETARRGPIGGVVYARDVTFINKGGTGKFTSKVIAMKRQVICKMERSNHK